MGSLCGNIKYQNNKKKTISIANYEYILINVDKLGDVNEHGICVDKKQFRNLLFFLS